MTTYRGLAILSEEDEELDENERDNVDKRIFRQVLSSDPEEVERERDEVGELLTMAEGFVRPS